MNWRFKVLRGTLYSLMPLNAAARRLKRRLRPPQGESPNTHYAVADGLKQIAALEAAGVSRDGTVLKMGSGWLPVIPLLFHVAGFRRLVVTDMERLMDERTVRIARDAIRARLPQVAAALGMSEDAARVALDHPFPIEYHAPFDPAVIPSGGVDAVICRCVFEHVRPGDLEAAMRNFRRMVRPGGLACHIVDNSDHWSHGNPGRSHLEFLMWRRGGWTEWFAGLNA